MAAFAIYTYKFRDVENIGCNGMIFEVPNFGQPYCYVFYNVKTKRVGKGGKFMLIR